MGTEQLNNILWKGVNAHDKNRKERVLFARQLTMPLSKHFHFVLDAKWQNTQFSWL